MCTLITFITLNRNILIFYIYTISSQPPVIQQGDWESRHVERSGSITSHSTGPNNKGGLKQYSRRYGFYGRMVVVVVVVAVVVVVGYPRMVGILVGLLTTGKPRSLKCLKSLACYILCVACLQSLSGTCESFPRKNQGVTRVGGPEPVGHAW